MGLNWEKKIFLSRNCKAAGAAEFIHRPSYYFMMIVDVEREQSIDYGDADGEEKSSAARNREALWTQE